jgi:hypothetical protein
MLRAESQIWIWENLDPGTTGKKDQFIAGMKQSLVKGEEGCIANFGAPPRTAIGTSTLFPTLSFIMQQT